jgi:hypothetical protein
LERAFVGKSVPEAVEIGGGESQSVESAAEAYRRADRRGRGETPELNAAFFGGMNGTYTALNGTFQGNRSLSGHSRSLAMIARPPTVNNASAEVIHRFHKARSCVFHSIHRF